jgi:DNA-binding helix-hairpin-helix protein with protein kinase domain
MTMHRWSGNALTLGTRIGGGGQGDIFEVSGRPGLVAKIYKRASDTPIAKLQEMLANPPPEPLQKYGHTSFTWPIELVADTSDTIIGYIMPYLPKSSHTELLNIYNTKYRLKVAPGFTWQYLMRIAKNVAMLISYVHKMGNVVGDLNESNIMVDKRALATLIDCDSFQVRARDGRTFVCDVRKDEYAPPEIRGAGVGKTLQSDNFILGILVFMLLMDGAHPFTGVWRGSGDPPPLVESVRLGNCPYVGLPIIAPPLYAPPFGILPLGIQRLFVQCFGLGHRQPGARPTAEEWLEALDSAEGHLTGCRRNSQHYYGNHLSRCPWCERLQQGLGDSFPQGAAAFTPAAVATGPIVCPVCRASNAASEIYCQHCAHRLGRARYCRWDGTPALVGGRFCTECGREL